MDLTNYFMLHECLLSYMYTVIIHTYTQIILEVYVREGRERKRKKKVYTWWIHTHTHTHTHNVTCGVLCFRNCLLVEQDAEVWCDCSGWRLIVQIPPSFPRSHDGKNRTARRQGNSSELPGRLIKGVGGEKKKTSTLLSYTCVGWS